MKQFIKKMSIAIILILSLSFTMPYSLPFINQYKEAQAATIKISKTKATLIKGETLTLKITGTKKTIKWSSNNKKVATVSKSGKVKALNVGKVTITAKVDNKKYTCKINIEHIDYKASNEEKIASYGLIFLDDSLKDPSSLEINKILYVDSYDFAGDKKVVIIDYSATNSYGGRIRSYLTTYLSDESTQFVSELYSDKLESYVLFSSSENKPTYNKETKMELDSSYILKIRDFYINEEDYTINYTIY